MHEEWHDFGFSGLRVKVGCNKITVTEFEARLRVNKVVSHGFLQRFVALLVSLPEQCQRGLLTCSYAWLSFLKWRKSGPCITTGSGICICLIVPFVGFFLVDAFGLVGT